MDFQAQMWHGGVAIRKEDVNRVLEQRITEWMRKVLAAHETAGMTDTQKMIADIDRIIAEEFDHDPVLEENQCQQTAGLSM